MGPDARKRMASRIPPGAADVPRYVKGGICKLGIVQSGTCPAYKSLLTKQMACSGGQGLCDSPKQQSGHNPRPHSHRHIAGIVDAGQDSYHRTGQADGQEGQAQGWLEVQVGHGDDGGGKHVAAGEGFSLLVPGQQGLQGPELVGPGPIDFAADQGEQQEGKGRDPEGFLETDVAGQTALLPQLPQKQGIGDVHEDHQAPVQKKQAPNGPGAGPEGPGKAGIGAVIMGFQVHGKSFL